MLKQRVLTALVLAPLGIAVLVFGNPALIAAVLGLVLAGGMREWVRLAGYGRPAQWLGALAGLALMALVWFTRTPDRLLAFAMVGVAFWMLSLAWLARPAFGRERTPGVALLKLLAGVLAMVPAMAAALSLRESAPHGQWWLLLAVALMWFGDSGAYFSGKRFGRRKLAPTISPGKTWEGVYGGIVAVAIAGTGAGWLLGLRGQTLALMVILVIVTLAFSIVGDLFESLMKRHAGMKDSGTLMPGHGGVLDRFDSLFAALPVFALGRHLIGA